VAAATSDTNPLRASSDETVVVDTDSIVVETASVIPGSASVAVAPP